MNLDIISFPNLPPGFYTVTAEAPGFKRFEKTQNKLDPNIATTVDADMQVGQNTETVNVVPKPPACSRNRLHSAVL